MPQDNSISFPAPFFTWQNWTFSQKVILLMFCSVELKQTALPVGLNTSWLSVCKQIASVMKSYRGFSQCLWNDQYWRGGPGTSFEARKWLRALEDDECMLSLHPVKVSHVLPSCLPDGWNWPGIFYSLQTVNPPSWVSFNLPFKGNVPTFLFQ